MTREGRLARKRIEILTRHIAAKDSGTLWANHMIPLGPGSAPVYLIDNWTLSHLWSGHATSSQLAASSLPG
jgi:hypothetical protein